MPLHPRRKILYQNSKPPISTTKKNLTQQQIANQLHVSRPTLNKLLKEALQEGMVKIEIIDYKNISQLIELEQKLCKKIQPRRSKSHPNLLTRRQTHP